MKSCKLLLEEIRYRPMNFFLSVLAIIAASTVFVAGPTLMDAYNQDTDEQVKAAEAKAAEEFRQLSDETRKIMLGMGFNLLIVHRDTDMAHFWAEDFSTKDMPEDYVNRLAKAKELTLVTHLVATLQEKIKWNNDTVLVVGYLKETAQSHRKKKTPMGYDIQPGTVYLGHLLRHGMEVGGTTEIGGKTFKIAKILDEKGSKEDITIAMHLSDAQSILKKEDRVNQILAIGCKCAGALLPKVRSELEGVLPETKITEFRSIALARVEQRDKVAERGKAAVGQIADLREGNRQKYEARAAVVMPLIVLACAIWVALLTLANVRERRGEIGIFRALGVGSMTIGSVFLGKAVLQGLIGAAIGLPLGLWLARWAGIDVLGINPEYVALTKDVALYTILGAPIVAAMASYLPTLAAITQDPATILRELQ